MKPENKAGGAPQQQKQKNSKMRMVVVILLIIIIILILLLLQRCGGDDSLRQNRDPNAAIGQIEGKSAEEIQAELDRVVEEGMFNISINPNIIFENGTAEGALRIENVPGNQYLMSVQITLADTGEVVYTSGLLEPNQHIPSAKLDVPLQKGSYKALATFTAYNTQTEAPEGQAAAEVVLQVNN